MRRGTVLERSCGRSNALRIRWDADDGRPSTEAWLADAAWHWSNGNLRVLASKAALDVPVDPPRDGDVADSEDLWLSGSPRATTARTAVGPGTAAGAAFDEWEAALAAETAPVDETSWEHVLAGALGIAGADGPADTGPAAPPLTPVTAVRLTAPASAVTSTVAATPGRAPAHAAPAPAPVAPAAPPAAPATPKAWTGDDIIPNRGRKGRRRG